MSVTTTLAACSQTVSANGPDGAVDPPSTLDDAIRYALSFIAQLRDQKAALGANTDITSLGSLASINGGQLAGLRNRIINGNFAINQRTVSGTVTLAAGAYGHDRWKAGAGGCTYTFATSGADTVITVSAGSLMQVIEGANIEGGTYRLSQQGTAQARIAVNGAATSGSYVANPQTSASATGGQNVTVEFTTGTIDRVQLEFGTVASTFERRPIGMELALCQRYYQVVFSNHRFSASAGGQTGASTVSWPTMRATPTTGLGSQTLNNISSAVLTGVGPSGGRLEITSTTNGDTYSLIRSDALTAEL